METFSEKNVRKFRHANHLNHQSKVENRFTGFNEVKLNSGKRDRANQEVFLHENPVALTNLTLEGLNKLWLKKHKSSLKSNSTKNVSVENYIKKDKSKAQFLE